MYLLLLKYFLNNYKHNYYQYYSNFGGTGFILFSYEFRGVPDSGTSLTSNAYRYYKSFKSGSGYMCLRPIVTLKSGINYTPSLGTSDDPFILN